MTELLIAFAAIAVFTTLLCRFAFRDKAAKEASSAQPSSATTTPTSIASSCASCTGQTSSCLQDCKLEAAVKPVEYYDDEELDAFRGRPSDSYTDEETDQFAEVLHTMRSDEVTGWLQSLSLRGIELPDALKDEAYMLVGE